MNDNKKRINNEQELFELFCDPHSRYAETHKPYYETQHKKVFSTDGYIVIFINPNMLLGSYEESEFLSIRKITLNPAEGHFTIESLKKTLESFGMEEERVIIEQGGECEECNGSGEVEWEYTDQDGEIHFLDSDCPVCNGDGTTKDVFKNTGFMMPTGNSLVRIGKSFFRGFVAQKLLWTMEYFNVDKAGFSEGEKTICFTLKNGVQIVVANIEPYGAFQNIVTLETTKQ